MIKKSFKAFCVLTLLLINPAMGQLPDTLRWDQAKQKIDIIKSGIVFALREEQSPEQAWQQMLLQKHYEQKATVGFTTDLYWIAFTYKNESAVDENKILEIDNPHIDWLSIYALDSLSHFYALCETGDKLLFTSRPIHHRNFIIPLRYAAGETRTILIKIDKRNSSLTFPTYLWTESIYHEKSYTINLWFGLFFGIIMLCLCYAFAAFVFLRKRIYAWYFLMTLTTALYLFTALGFSFQYLYPQVADLNSKFRIVLTAVLFLSITIFTKDFLRFAIHQPRINRFLNYTLTAACLLLLAYCIAEDFMTKNALWFITMVYVIYLVGFFSVFYGAVKSFHQQRAATLIYVLAWSVLFVGYILVLLSEFGLIPIESFPINPVLIGSSLETLVFSVGLTYQVSRVYSERNQLSLTLAKQQKELLKAYVEGTEKERQRISRELHDDIGSRLASLKRFLSAKESGSLTLEKQIDILCNDVRTMSHQLAPAGLEISDFRQLITQLIEETSRQQKLKIDVQFYDIPKILSPQITHHLFRIVQEAISNVLKHAGATELDLQFFGHENEMVMTIEDNGRGFDSTSRTRGIGLQNINARVESMSGTIEISSVVNQGTNIMVKIPMDQA